MMETRVEYALERWIPGERLFPPRTDGEWWRLARGISTPDELKIYLRPGWEHRLVKTIIMEEIIPFP